MIGRRGSLFAALAASALMLSGTAHAQPQSPNQLPQVFPAPNSAPPPVPPGSGPAPTLPPLPGTSSLPTPQPFPVPTLSPRFSFKIEPNAPVKDLLPVAPRGQLASGPLLTDDLNAVPEVEFEGRPEKLPEPSKQLEQAAHQLAKIDHLNAKKTDAFMAALIENRSDLAGLPFAMGDDCRSGPERAKCFTAAVGVVRQAMQNGGSGRAFWTNFN
ncbi:MAG TPA: hypothetical protein VGE74_08395, partial [Gemmata sp.]